MKKKFKVDVCWTLSGTIEIEAEDTSEANKIANLYDGFPEEQHYVDGSFEVLEVEEVKD